MAALAKVPADRPQTAKQFCEIMGTPAGSTSTRRTGARMTGTRHPSVRITAQQLAATRELAAYAPLPFWKRPLAWIAALLILAVAGGLGYWRSHAGTGGNTGLPAGPDPHDIAVLYFADLAPQKDLGYLADGLTEGLIDALSGVRGLSVVSKGGAAQYRGRGASLDSIATALQVGTIVYGSVEPDGDKVKVTVRLYDAGGTEFDHASFEQPRGSSLTMVDSLSEEAARLIRTRLKEEIRVREQRAATSNPDAWAMQQRAELARKRGDSLFAAGNESGFQRQYAASDSLAAGAEKLDGKWIDPVLLRGWLDYWRSRRTSDSLPLEVARIADSGLIHAGRAVALDKGNADALQLRGDLRYWRWIGTAPEKDPAKAALLLAGAQEDLEAATKANPGQAGAWATLSHLYYHVKDKGGHDIVFAARKALEEDAFLGNANVILNRLFQANYDLGEGVEAKHWCEEGQHRFPADPNFVLCQLLVMTTNAQEPDPALAWKLADSLVALTPESNRPYQRLNGQAGDGGGTRPCAGTQGQRAAGSRAGTRGRR